MEYHMFYVNSRKKLRVGKKNLIYSLSAKENTPVKLSYLP
jgi:hypothetical protein